MLCSDGCVLRGRGVTALQIVLKIEGELSEA
jgi:hypothetical protein